MRWMAVAAVAVLATVAPFGVQASGSNDAVALDLPAEGTLDLAANGGAVLRPTGENWGRLVLTSAVEQEVRLVLTHDTMDDLGIFSQDGWGIYDESHFTFIDLEGAGNGYWFEWWGTPEWPIWPHSSTDFGWGESIVVGPENDGALRVSNNVPGFTITLVAGDGSSLAPDPLAWNLLAHPDLHLLLPEPSDAATLDTDAGHVNRLRLWSGATSVPASDAYARSWTYERGTTARAGFQSDRLGVSATGGATGSTQPSPTWSVGTGGWHLSASTAHRVFLGGGDLTFWRDLRETMVGTDATEGAAFLTLPRVGPTP